MWVSRRSRGSCVRRKNATDHEEEMRSRLALGRNSGLTAQQSAPPETPTQSRASCRVGTVPSFVAPCISEQLSSALQAGYVAAFERQMLMREYSFLMQILVHII
jgi:hypothetical protein